MKHRHHIIPRHMGGTNNPSNIVELTPEEHAEAHRVLYEQHGKIQDKMAWIGLSQKRRLSPEEILEMSKVAQKETFSDPTKKAAWQEKLRKAATKQHAQMTIEQKAIISKKTSETLKRMYVEGSMRYHPPRDPSIGRKNYYKIHGEKHLCEHAHKSERWQKVIRSEEYRTRKRVFSKNRKPVSVNGQICDSIRHAAKVYGTSYTKFRRILNLNRDKDVFYC